MKLKFDIAMFCIFLIRLCLTVLLVVTAGKYSDATSLVPNATQNASTWKESMQKVKKLIPFLWPKGAKLQFLVICCFILLAVGRIVNVLVPLSYKYIIDDLTPSEATPEHGKRPLFSWMAILGYTFLRFLQGGVGLLSSLQSFLWIPVSQYTTREICVRMLEHLHSLSLDFHIKRKTGEVLRVMDRGTASIGSLLSYLAFNIMPVFVGLAHLI
jgi:ATP-binding cassette, subfamily B (MDR/TAP), member 6